MWQPDVDEIEVVGAERCADLGTRGRCERDGFAVLAAVEDDLGRDAVVVEIAQPGVHVVVPVTRVARQGRVRRFAELAEHRPHLRRLGGPLVEFIEERRRAVRAQVVHQARPDVGVRRDDDERRRVDVPGVRTCSGR